MTQYSGGGSRDEFNNLEIWGETTTANYGTQKLHCPCCKCMF